MTNALITGWGMYAPSRVMTNHDLEKLVDTSDEWIVSRTGIRERRIAADARNRQRKLTGQRDARTRVKRVFDRQHRARFRAFHLNAQ